MDQKKYLMGSPQDAPLIAAIQHNLFSNPTDILCQQKEQNVPGA